jgi:hypothetical protein
MAFASTFELQRADGTPADPPRLTTVAHTWRPGDVIPDGRYSLRVIEVATATTTATRYWSSRTCPNERLAPLFAAA